MNFKIVGFGILFFIVLGIGIVIYTMDLNVSTDIVNTGQKNFSIVQCGFYDLDTNHGYQSFTCTIKNEQPFTLTITNISFTMTNWEQGPSTLTSTGVTKNLVVNIVKGSGQSSLVDDFTKFDYTVTITFSNGQKIVFSNNTTTIES